jgi:hypothetical protein
MARMSPKRGDSGRTITQQSLKFLAFFRDAPVKIVPLVFGQFRRQQSAKAFDVLLSGADEGITRVTRHHPAPRRRTGADSTLNGFG